MKFIASRISEGNKLFPAEIHIQENGISIRIPGFFSGDTTSINYESISAVEIDTPLIGYSTIRFFHNGNKVQAHGFSKSDVKQIKGHIEDGRSRIKRNKAQKHERIIESEPYQAPPITAAPPPAQPITQIINKPPGIFSTVASAIGDVTKNAFDEHNRVLNEQKEAKERLASKLEEILKITFNDNKEEIINSIQYLITLGLSKPDKTVKRAIIEKIEFGIMKLGNKDAGNEIAFFEAKLDQIKKKSIFDYIP